MKIKKFFTSILILQFTLLIVFLKLNLSLCRFFFYLIAFSWNQKFILSSLQENRLRAASAKYVLAACCCTTLRTRRFIKTRISHRWNSWSCRIMITPLIATVSAANCALTRTARTMVIASIKSIATYASVLRVMPRMTALLISMNASTTNVKMVLLASMVLPITPVSVRTAGRDGCKYFFFLNYFSIDI